MHQIKYPVYYFSVVILLFLFACKGASKPAEKQLVSNPETIDDAIRTNIEDVISFATEHSGKLNDSVTLVCMTALKTHYETNGFEPVWSSREKWKPNTNALVNYLSRAELDGLYRDDYHFSSIMGLKESLDRDSLKRMDAVLWTKADILLSDSFLDILQDLSQGRLQPDSLAWLNNDEKISSWFLKHFNEFRSGIPLDTILLKVQPVNPAYHELKSGISHFLDSMDTRQYTYVNYPYKKGDATDSAGFIKDLLQRLDEAGVSAAGKIVDSARLSDLVKKYQVRNKLKTDGKISSSFIRFLNTTDIEKFSRIAVTLDRYKQLPSPMPEKYIWVNLPSFTLQLRDADTVVFSSKVICGKPETSTPEITSAISNLIIFPTWTVPTSIIKKEMLPGLKKNAGYLAKKGLNLYDNKGELVDPYSVDWTKYSKGIPYKIQQGSGEDNALGVIKFNFNNPFDVYLHDTNQRYLFGRSMRALSHGCVRVQEWEKLAFYLVRNDSMQLSVTDTMKYNTDSITSWIANKEKHRLELKNKIPLFIRYFGCEAINGRIRFYDDIYDEDRKARDRFLKNKKFSFK